MRRIYVSGAMSGIEEPVYRKRFCDAEGYLRKQGYKVFNPCRWVWILRFFPYRVALAFDLLMMCLCDGVYMLDGWTESGGAGVEHRFACATGMIIMYER